MPIKIHTDSSHETGLDIVWQKIIMNIPIKHLWKMQFVCKSWYRLIQKHRPDEAFVWRSGNIISWRDFHPTDSNITIDPADPGQLISSSYYSDCKPVVLYYGHAFMLETPWLYSPFGAQKNLGRGFYGEKEPPKKVTLSLELMPDVPITADFSARLVRYQKIVARKVKQLFMDSRFANQPYVRQIPRHLENAIVKDSKVDAYNNLYQPPLLKAGFKCRSQSNYPYNKTPIFSYRGSGKKPNQLRINTWQEIISSCTRHYRYKLLIKCHQLMAINDMFFLPCYLEQVLMRRHNNEHLLYSDGACLIPDDEEEA